MSASPPLAFRERVRVGVKLGLMTGLAAWCAYAVSSLLGLKEGYWAAIFAIVVLQQDLTAARGQQLRGRTEAQLGHESGILDDVPRLHAAADEDGIGTARLGRRSLRSD